MVCQPCDFGVRKGSRRRRDKQPVGATKPRKAKGQGHITGRLRAADPFELIRWLARSQHDPRKALAELVQNSLDAGATHI